MAEQKLYRISDIWELSARIRKLLVTRPMRRSGHQLFKMMSLVEKRHGRGCVVIAEKLIL